jgi:hypothetical protein
MSLLSVTNRTTSVNANAKTFPNIVPFNSGTSWATPDIFVNDNSGNIYFASSGGSAIYKTTIAGGTPVLFAGSPTQSGSSGPNSNYLNSRFTYILDLAIDGVGTLYVVDGNWISYFTTTGSPTAGTISTNPSSVVNKISVNSLGTRILVYDAVYARLYYFACTSAPYQGVGTNCTVNLASIGRPTSIYSLSCVPDGGSGVFLVIVPALPTVYVSDGNGGIAPTTGNTVYSVTNFTSTSATFTAYTIDGSASASLAAYYEYLLFTSSTTGYALAGSSYNVITVNTSTNAITTNSSQLGNNNLSLSSKLGFYSDSLNTAVLLSTSGNSDGLYAIQPIY